MSVFTPPTLLDAQRWKHLNIGLFGGTFNPPHEGHLHVCEHALKALNLDFIWWMVTPQNPLKKCSDIPSFDNRITLSQKIVNHPQILVTDIEKQLNTHVSINTIHKLKLHFPATNFIWLAGTDNALTLHKWEGWKEIIHETGFFFVSRPPSISILKQCPVRILSPKVNKMTQRGTNKFKPGENIWCLNTPLVKQSSTNIRSAD